MGKTKIFYLDDDLDDLMLFMEVAKNLPNPINVIAFNSTTDFLTALETMEMLEVIVFLDINMPDKNGFDILKTLKKTAKFQSLPVIIYSTSREQIAINICKEFGADFFAIKPTSYEAIGNIIKKAIDVDWQNRISTKHHFVLNRAD
jgi:CheY-like chemotaxis protein